MLKKKAITVVFCGMLLFVITGIQSLHAVDAYVSSLYKQIDIAFLNKSDTELNTVLQENQKDDNYYLLEMYVMKKIRRLIVDSEYKFAMQADLVVIDNNLDNTEAVELYSVISSALEMQMENERIIAEKKKAELARIEAEKEKQRVAADREFRSFTTSSGDAVYVSRKEEKYSSTFWSFKFGMFDGMFVTDASEDYMSFRYGISGDYTYEYSYDSIAVGIDLNAEGILIPIYNGDETILGSFVFAPKMGFNNISKHLFFRAGFASLFRIKMGDESILQENFYTPLLGIGFNHVMIGSATLSGNYDYYLGHFAYDNLITAMGGSLNLSLPLADTEKIKLNFNIGLKDNILIKDSGIENRAGIILAIGAENVTK